MTRRTTTTAVLLLGVAVGGVSGCVAVRPEAGPGAGTGAVRPAAPRIVQPPAREALEAATPPRRTPPKRQAAVEAVPPPPEKPEPPRRPAPVRPPAPPPPTRAPAPVTPPKLPDLRAGLCALGGRYGAWAPDSPQSRACEKAYGD